MKHRRLLKISLATFALLVFAGLALLTFTVRSPTADLTLTHMTNTVHGPVATFEKSFKPSRLVRRNANSSSTRISVFRHGQWTDLTPAEVGNRVFFTPGLVDFVPGGRRVANFGYTFEIKVPVCQKWKVTFDVAESRRIGSKFLHLTISQTNTWTSPDLPGWSEIRRSYNQTPATTPAKL